MKHKTTLLLLALGAIALTFGACLRDDCTSVRTYVRFDPVFKSLAEIRTPVRAEAPRTLHKPGKLYVFDKYLFINELHEGIHVIDNSDAANPVPVAFWALPGNVDIAVRGNYLYADQGIDLVTLDISNMQNPTEVCRQQNVFQTLGQDPVRGVIVDYTESNVTETIDCNDARFNQPWFWFEGGSFFADAALANSSGPNTNVPAVIGIAGSYARFAQYDQYLYCVDRSTLRTFSLANASCPSPVGSQVIGWEIETIFPYGDQLFIGSQSGMFVFSVANPAAPVQLAAFQHARACDPVICDGDYAYVTLHDGTRCQGFANQLDVVDIRNLPNATLASTTPLKHPKGLTAAGDYLYVCDDGLKIFDKSQTPVLTQKAHLLAGQDTYDAIALGQSRLLVTGPGGFRQYDISNPTAPVELSFLPVVQ